MHNFGTTTIVNCTPHAINLFTPEGVEIAVFAPATTPARVNMTKTQVGVVEVNGVMVPIYNSKPGSVVGLPEPDGSNTVYIVSLITALQLPHRDDVITVDDTVRNEAGQVIGCAAFAAIKAI